MTEENEKRLCKNCDYWAHVGSYGQCRRDPPKIISKSQPNDVTGYWPQTQNDEWCGEFHVRYPEDEA